MKADPAVVGQAVYEDMVTDLRTDIAKIAAPMTVLYHTDWKRAERPRSTRAIMRRSPRPS